MYRFFAAISLLFLWFSANAAGTLPVSFGFVSPEGELHNNAAVFDGERYQFKIFLTGAYTPAMDTMYAYIYARDASGRGAMVFPRTEQMLEKQHSLKNLRNGDSITTTKLRIAPPFGIDHYLMILTNVAFIDPIIKEVVRGGEPAVTVEDIDLRVDGSPLSKLNNSQVISKMYRTYPASEASAFKSGEPPVLFVAGTLRSSVFQTEDFKYKISGSAFHPGGLKEVMVNGKTAFYDSVTSTFELIVPLIAGENSLEIQANSYSGHSTVQLITVIHRKELVTFVPGVTWFVGIGINNYADRNWVDLRNARSDMEDVFRTLKEQYNCGVKNSILLVDEQATRKAILDTLQHLKNVTGVNDNVIIYYSGHGYYDELSEMGYWIPSDGVGLKATSLISYRELLLYVIKPCKARHIVMMIDACFSGSLLTYELSRGFDTDSIQPHSYYDKVEKFRSRKALTSGRMEEVSDGAAGKHSPFAQAILDYCVAAEHKVFSIDDLSAFVKRSVSDNAAQTPMSGTLDNVGDGGGEFVFRRN